MFENNGKWYGYREGASKKAFSTKEEAEAYENGTEKLKKLQEIGDRADWFGEADGSKETEESSEEKAGTDK
jgi:dsDNA-binding SOS-regulon protein